MTLQVTELMGSRSLNRDINSDSFTGSRTFLIYDDEGSLVSLKDAVNADVGVYFDDQHPDVVGIYASTFSCNASKSRADTWELSWKYAVPSEDTDAGGSEFSHEGLNTDIDPEDDFDEPVIDAGSSGEDDEGVGGEDGGQQQFTGVTVSTGIALVDGFKSGAGLPASIDTPAESAISGNTVHTGGRPITIPVPVCDISMSTLVGGQTFYLNNINTLAGKRNSAEFMGLPAGSVVFKGMNVQRTGVSLWRVTHNFAWDEWYHLRQVPKRDEQGNVSWNDSTPRILEIYWKQPFPSTTGFEFAP